MAGRAGGSNRVVEGACRTDAAVSVLSVASRTGQAVVGVDAVTGVAGRIASQAKARRGVEVHQSVRWADAVSERSSSLYDGRALAFEAVGGERAFASEAGDVAGHTVARRSVHVVAVVAAARAISSDLGVRLAAEALKRGVASAAAAGVVANIAGSSSSVVEVARVANTRASDQACVVDARETVARSSSGAPTAAVVTPDALEIASRRGDVARVAGAGAGGQEHGVGRAADAHVGVREIVCTERTFRMAFGARSRQVHEEVGVAVAGAGCGLVDCGGFAAGALVLGRSCAPSAAVVARLADSGGCSEVVAVLALAAARSSEGDEAVGVDRLAAVALGRSRGRTGSAGDVASVRNAFSDSRFPVEASCTGSSTGACGCCSVGIAGRAGGSIDTIVTSDHARLAGASSIHVLAFSAGAGSGSRKVGFCRTGQTVGSSSSGTGGTSGMAGQAVASSSVQIEARLAQTEGSHQVGVVLALGAGGGVAVQTVVARVLAHLAAGLRGGLQAESGLALFTDSNLLDVCVRVAVCIGDFVGLGSRGYVCEVVVGGLRSGEECQSVQVVVQSQLVCLRPLVGRQGDHVF